MIKKWLNVLSRYPRLRVLLVILLVLVVLIIIANLFTGKKQMPAEKVPPSRVVLTRINPTESKAKVDILKPADDSPALAQAVKPASPKATNASEKDKGFFSGLFDNKTVAPPEAPPLIKPVATQPQVSSSPTLPASDTSKVEKPVKRDAVAKPLTPAEIERAKALSGSMRSYLGNAGLNNAPGFSAQQMVVGSVSTNSTLQSSLGKNSLNVMIKAGTIQFGILTNALNSDYPGTPVLAEIVTGKFRHAKLMGSFALANDALVIKFTMMSMPDWPSTIPINAYAIDADTGQNALATGVDNHYLQRYGSLMAAAFLQGYGQAYANAANNGGCVAVTGGPPCVVDSNGTVPQPSSKSAMFQGLGQIGTNLGAEIGQNFNRPPTVTVDQGTSMGLLFMQDTMYPQFSNSITKGE
jgi:intracellular multiplication protein IcmE